MKEQSFRTIATRISLLSCSNDHLEFIPQRNTFQDLQTKIPVLKKTFKAQFLRKVEYFMVKSLLSRSSENKPHTKETHPRPSSLVQRSIQGSLSRLCQAILPVEGKTKWKHLKYNSYSFSSKSLEFLQLLTCWQTRFEWFMTKESGVYIARSLTF